MSNKISNAQDIRNELEKAIAITTARINAWKNVTRLYKKDGSDFKVFSKNFANADIYCNYMDRNVIGVHFMVPGYGYQTDEINIWVYADEYEGAHRYSAFTHKYNPDGRVMCGGGWIREWFYLTPDEVIEEIKKKIDSDKKQLASYKEQLAKTEDVFNEFAEAIAKALNDLKEKAGINSTLYYSCRDYMRNAY